MRIPEYFAGKNILVTGATGCVGKALVAKLLNSCPEIGNIYVIIRTRKDVEPQNRWEEIVKSRLFDHARNERPESLSKIVVMEGDNKLNNYGLSPENVKLLEDNVNIIYHGAASINFVEEFVSAILVNMKSTATLCEMATRMKRFERFVQISTAYCNIHRDGETEEKVYECPVHWRSMIALAESPKHLDQFMALQARLMFGHSSTYTLTKAMSENIVEDYSQYFPVAIMRVALVIGSAFDPEPGWADFATVFAAQCIGVRAGVIRTGLCKPEIGAPQIPLDTTTKCLLVAPWSHHSKDLNKGVEVVCCANSDETNFTNQEIRECGYNFARDYPWRFSLYYPFIIFTSNIYLYKVLYIFLHLLPGIFLDKMAEYNGKKPMLVKIYRRIWKLTPMIETGINGYKFVRTNYEALEDSLLPEDRKDFSLDESKYLPKPEYFRVSSFITLESLFNKKDNMEPERVKLNRKRLTKQRIIHICLVVLLGITLAQMTAALCSWNSHLKIFGSYSVVAIHTFYCIMVAIALKETVSV